MKITALVENRPGRGLKAAHGLSLYIETARHRLLFDLGPDDTLFENADKLGIDLSLVDTVILSHGHADHGGALEAFLGVNHRATVYAQRKAFEPHYSRVLSESHYIGLDKALERSPRIRLLDGDLRIDGELGVFTVPDTHKCHSPANDTLRDRDGADSFGHEQNLIISGEAPVLIMGCGHTGVVNILEKAGAYQPRYCIGGYHLYNPRTKQTAAPELLEEIAAELRRYPGTDFYTCHCTGEEAFRYLEARLPNMRYLSCGDCIEI